MSVYSESGISSVSINANQMVTVQVAEINQTTLTELDSARHENWRWLLAPEENG